MASYGATDPGWPGAGNSNWPPAPSGSGRPIRGATDIPGPRPPMRVRSVMPARYQADEEDQNQRLGTHSGTESSANFGRSLHAALHDGHLNTIEDLKDHPLPSHWMDMSHDLEGIKQFTLHGGIFLWLVMIVSSVAGLITIYSGGGKISVFWISIVAVIPLAIQLGDISVLLSHWCVKWRLCRRKFCGRLCRRRACPGSACTAARTNRRSLRKSVADKLLAPRVTTPWQRI